MKVSIKDFQSIKEAELKIEGFTAVVGKSNIGKSALWRSIEGALFGRSGDGFIRQGSSHMQVHLEDDGLDVLWEKGKGVNRFTVNGNVYDKVNRTVPPEIQNYGYREIEIGDKKSRIQFSSQWTPLFLIDPDVTSGSQAANVLISVSRMDELLEAIKKCSAELREKKQVKKIREGDLKKVKDQLLETSDIIYITDRVSKLGTVNHEIKSLDAEITWSEEILRELDRLNEEIALLEPVARWEGVDINKLDDRQLVALKTILAKLRETEGVEGINLEPFPPIREFEEGVEKDLKALNKLGSILVECEGCKETFELSHFPEINLDGELELYGKMRSLLALADEIQSLQEQHNSLDTGVCPMCGKKA